MNELIKVNGLKYCGDEIVFDPPINITCYYPYDDGEGIYGVVEYDFGMEVYISLEPKKNFLIWGYRGLSEKSSHLDILRLTAQFDLEHAFFHPEEDPNYSHLHWALKGWLKDRATILKSS